MKERLQFFMWEENNQKHVTKNSYLQNAVNVIFTQVQATKGFKLFGELATIANIKELRQL